MNRRAFIQRSVLGASSLAAARLWSADVPGRDARPNILFIWTDQHAAGAMSCAGNPWVNTPALDGLAASGVRFEQTYCTNPICVPSRTSWLTGRMAHETGVMYNTERAPVTVPALSRTMRDAGYATGYIGKWHIPRTVDDLDWHGFEFLRATRGKGIDARVAVACAEFLDQPREGPFFLCASFVNPHDICEWAREEAGVQSPLPNGELSAPPPLSECPPLPENFGIPAHEPEVVRALARAVPTTYPTQEWDVDSWRRYLWAYYRLIERVDAQITDLLAALRVRDLDENTLIVYSSDHGDGMAAHHWNQKTMFYDEVVRVPFIVRPPGGGRGRLDDSALVSMNLDFFPTVFDYAGIEPPADLPGRSVRPLIEKRSGARGHEFIVAQNEPAPVYDAPGGVQGRMITDGRWKYLRYSQGDPAEQLFDRESDPGELHDLTRDPSHRDTLAIWRERLATWMDAHGDEWPATKATYLS